MKIVASNNRANYNYTISNKIEAGIVLKEKKKSTQDEIIKHCNNYLGKFKSPDKVHFFDELPKGSSGKIQRLKIKDFI